MSDLLHEMLVEMARDTRARDAIKVDREHAEADINYFAEKVLKFKQGPIHRETQTFWDENLFSVIEAWVGSGKSTQGLFVRPLHKLCKDPDETVLANSSNSDNLRDYLSQCQTEIHTNQIMRTLWPHMRREERKNRPRAWRSDAFTIMRSDRWFDERSSSSDAEIRIPSYRIISTGSKKQGTRARTMIADDPLSDITAWSAATRENEKHWLDNTFLSRHRPGGGSISIINTPGHIDDWCHNLVRKRGFVKRTFSGDDWEKLWPVSEQGEHIARMKQHLAPHAYARLIQCIPISGAFMLFDEKIMDECATDVPYGIHNQGDLAKCCRVLVGLDLAGTRKTRKSTQTCLFVWMLTNKGKLRVVQIIQGQFNLSMMLRKILEILAAMPRAEFIVEDNGIQIQCVNQLRDADFARSIGATPEDCLRLGYRIKTWTTGQNKHDREIGIQSMDGGFRAQRFEFADNQDTLDWRQHFMQYSADPRSHTKDDLMASWFPWAWLQDHASVDINPDDMMGIAAGPEGEHIELDEILQPGDQSELLAGMAL